MCIKPYRQGVAEFGCGQCMPCRLNRRRLWTIRLLLEARLHDVPSWFVTLTYNDENLPTDGCVRPRDLQLFLKRLRHAAHPARIRFYGVGEYGDISLRPHYHLVLYGLANPGLCELAWPHGFAYVGELSEQSAAYVVSYTTKGLTRDGDLRLQGKHPEFARMSLRPGIGAKAAKFVADATVTRGGSSLVGATGDVPSVVRYEKGLWPLGRYIRRKVREEMGMEPGQPESTAARRAAELQAELRQPGARAAREEKREQVGRRAAVLKQISNSKKGTGI